MENTKKYDYTGENCASGHVSALAREQANAYAYIDMQVLVDFLSQYAYEYLGAISKNGTPLTIRDEIGEIAKMTHKAYVDMGNISFTNSELSKEEQQEKKSRLIRNAAKKLLFLNRLCMEYTGKHFVKQFVDSKDAKANTDLVDAFEYAIRCYGC